MGENGTKIPILHSPSFLIVLEVENPPHSSRCKNQHTALTDGKMGIFATHRHSPPQRLVRMGISGYCRPECDCSSRLAISIPHLRHIHKEPLLTAPKIPDRQKTRGGFNGGGGGGAYNGACDECQLQLKLFLFARRADFQ